MIRALAMCFVLVTVTAGQPPRSRQPDVPKAETLTVDATATDENDHIIPGLTAKDFELTHAGQPQEIDGVKWIAGPRNVIVIVDDLGLMPERVLARQEQLRKFEKELAAHDRAALIRTSSGGGWQEILSTDRKLFSEQIDRIQPVGRGVSDAVAANAISQAVRWAFDGLQSENGRKVVAILGEPSHLTELRENSNLIHMAGRASAVFYLVASNPPPGPTAFSKDTGGLVVPDLASVLLSEQGHYLLSFSPDKSGQQNLPAILKPRGRMANLRWRNGFVPNPDTDRALYLAPPTAGGELHTSITALYSGLSKTNAVVDVIVHIDGHDISMLRDLKGLHHGSLDLQLLPYSVGGKAPGSLTRSVAFDLDDAKYAMLLQGGSQFSARLNLPGSGGFQIRAVISDGLSGRIGSAMTFLDIPPVEKGVLAISGIVLKKADAPGEAAESSDSQAIPAMPVYRPGAAIPVMYGVFNATNGPEKQARLRVQTRIYASAHTVYTGKPSDLDFPPNTGAVCQVAAKVNLDSTVSPGYYTVEVEVADLLAKEGTQRVATQYRTFEVRE